jgi:hypothetical protein
MATVPLDSRIPMEAPEGIQLVSLAYKHLPMPQARYQSESVSSGYTVQGDYRIQIDLRAPQSKKAVTDRFVFTAEKAANGQLRLIHLDHHAF